MLKPQLVGALTFDVSLPGGERLGASGEVVTPRALHRWGWLATVPDVRNGRAGRDTAVAGFVQIIEFQTSRIDEFESLIDEIRSQPGPMPVVRATLTEDRDRPGYYVNIVEFESYEQAMENSNKPETSAMAERMAALCDGPPKFYNLDVRRSDGS